MGLYFFIEVAREDNTRLSQALEDDPLRRASAARPLCGAANPGCRRLLAGVAAAANSPPVGQVANLRRIVNPPKRARPAACGLRWHIAALGTCSRTVRCSYDQVEDRHQFAQGSTGENPPRSPGRTSRFGFGLHFPRTRGTRQARVSPGTASGPDRAIRWAGCQGPQMGRKRTRTQAGIVLDAGALIAFGQYRGGTPVGRFSGRLRRSSSHPDLAPHFIAPIEAVKKLFPKKRVIVACPPGRFSPDALCRLARLSAPARALRCGRGVLQTRPRMRRRQGRRSLHV